MLELPPAVLEDLTDVRRGGWTDGSVPTFDAGEGEFVPGTGAPEVWTFQMWKSPNGQLWTVTMSDAGAFVITSIQQRVTEDGRLRVTEDGRQRITEG